MKNLPAHLELYHRTEEFTENTVPKGLLKDHRTKANVWGRIVVSEGVLRYIIQNGLDEDNILSPEVSGVVEPQVFHFIKPEGRVRFHVEFYR